jgi:hypothetical protein
MSTGEGPPEPWRSFFDDLDRLLPEPVALHCFGGFALIYAYEVARTTNDVDFIGVVPNPMRRTLSELGGRGSALHGKHKVYLDPVTVATLPDGYEARLKPLFSGSWRRVQLYALEAHDLALSKLERNFERDRDDVERLARAGHIHPEVLRSRYYEELRPYLAHQQRSCENLL